MKNYYDIIIRPIITEKSLKKIDADIENQYTFEVKQGANKVEIKKAVEEIFDVKVAAVRTINCQRKSHRVGKYEGMRPAVRKAIVKLTADSKKIDAFEI